MNKPRILIVDDEPGFTRMLKIALPRYNVCEENDATRALATAESFQPDLILMDVIMPGIDGGNLAIKMRKQPALKDVPILFVTAVVPTRDASDAPKEYGGFPFLAKPVDSEVLRRCIAEYLPAA